LHVGLPASGSTWIAQVAQAAAGRGGLFAAFQISSAVLLLAAASSSFQAGPGLLKALARGGGGAEILPRLLARRNRHHTPYWGVAVFLTAAALLVVAAGGQEQRLVLFYAVAVFIAFCCGLAAMTRFFHRDRRPWLTGVSVAGGLAVALTLGVDFARGYPIVSFLAAGVIAAILYMMWVRAGRPRGVAQSERLAELDDRPPGGTSPPQHP
jgi:amino acid transporter